LECTPWDLPPLISCLFLLFSHYDPARRVVSDHNAAE
jgi:hypothetical protein